jgi:hypothetical protein
MRHRRFIVAQAALAGAFAITAMCSYAFVLSAILPLSSNNCLLFAVFEGRARIFFVHSSQPMVVNRSGWYPGFLLESDDRLLALPARAETRHFRPRSAWEAAGSWIQTITKTRTSIRIQCATGSAAPSAQPGVRRCSVPHGRARELPPNSNPHLCDSHFGLWQSF